MKKISVINGPNLNLLGERSVEIYGTKTLDELMSELVIHGKTADLKIETHQSNHEGIIIDMLHQIRKKSNGVIINAGAYSHYSYAIRDAIEAINIPVIEVHISDIYKREDFRKHSVLSDVCYKSIVGHGDKGYFEAVDVLKSLFDNNI